MATTEEKQELIDTIKNPIRYYRVQLTGYGGEAAYMELTKEQYEYWNAVEEDELLDYMLDDEMEIEVPEQMDFMRVEGEDYRSSWYEAPTEFSHQFGVDYSSCRIYVEEVDGDDYDAGSIEEVLDGELLQEYLDNLMEQNEYEVELVEMGVEDAEPNYVLQFYSSEKGGFFDGTITTNGKFDPMKLKIYTTEYPNGDDIVSIIEYDGIEVENGGGDTNGKGYSVHLWKNVE